ncbi:MAG: 1-acyl-sn-glycerol-3-phosphate acyltransferase [Leptospiraceae bacterium]|nr:1-acyl-sn-glycerol-3-phosphate acyltransferase [Leptospiraceae bacterium]
MSRVKRIQQLLDASKLDSIDRYFDHEYARSLSKNVLEFLGRNYFRPRLIGFDEPDFPATSGTPLIYAGNHSGMSFPWDAIMFSASLYAKRGYEMQDACRALVAPALSLTSIMNPYFIDNFWKKTGGVDASLGNFEELLQRPGAAVLIYPEGIAGIGKGFEKRYQLQRFSNSFIRMALKFKTDIVPVLTVNGEFINPMGYKSDFLNSLAQKVGIPFVPVGPITALVTLFPWSFYFGLPARLTYLQGRRISLREIAGTDYDQMGQRELNQIRIKVQESIQTDLDQAVADYGKDPFAVEELLQIWIENRDQFLYIFPSGWPLLFKEHERLFLRDTTASMSHDNLSYLKALWSHPGILAYHTPFYGWPMLLSRHGLGMRKNN